jgi:DNA-binding response OmpR family regulator
MKTPPLRILCADDETPILDLLATLFSDAGHIVETASDGQTAFEMLQEQPAGFDLLITDGVMPRLDGAGLIVQARAAGYEGKVVIFSGSLEDPERVLYRSLGVDAIVAKPGMAEIRSVVAAIAQAR